MLGFHITEHTHWKLNDPLFWNFCCSDTYLSTSYSWLKDGVGTSEDLCVIWGSASITFCKSLDEPSSQMLVWRFRAHFTLTFESGGCLNFLEGRRKQNTWANRVTNWFSICPLLQNLFLVHQVGFKVWDFHCGKLDSKLFENMKYILRLSCKPHKFFFPLRGGR